MKVGELVWFDSYYHAVPEYQHPQEYSLKAIILKKYSFQEKYRILGINSRFENEELYEILVEGSCVIATSGTLIPIFRRREEI